MSEHHRFKFTPSVVLTQSCGSYGWLPTEKWYAAYQWFVQKLCEFAPDSTPYEFVNGTSSINNHQCDPIRKRRYASDEPQRRLAMLLAHIGSNYRHGQFLAFCGLKKWSDLAKPFFVCVKHSDKFPNDKWFELQGREFIKSPNSYHSEATWIHSGSIQLNNSGELWRVILTYGYKRDSSCWDYFIHQEKGENLGDFADRVDAELQSILKPDQRGEIGRLQDERDWGHSYESVRNLFYDPHYNLGEWENDLADGLLQVKGSSVTANKIRLTPSRLKTVKRWIEEQVTQ